MKDRNGMKTRKRENIFLQTKIKVTVVREGKNMRQAAKAYK